MAPYVESNYGKVLEYMGMVEQAKKRLTQEVERMEDGLKRLAVTSRGEPFEQMKAMVEKETKAVRGQLEELKQKVQRKLDEERIFLEKLRGRR